MFEAVGGQFGGDQLQIRDRLGRQTQSLPIPGNDRAGRPEVVGGPNRAADRYRVSGQWPVVARQRISGGVLRTAVPRTVLPQQRMGHTGVGQNISAQAASIVGAQHRRVASREGRVDQRFVLHTRGIFVVGAARPHRLTDDSYRPALVSGGESALDPKNPARVAADVGQIGQRHVPARIPQRGPQQRKFALRDRDQHRFGAGQPVENKRHHHVEKFRLGPVEQREMREIQPRYVGTCGHAAITCPLEGLPVPDCRCYLALPRRPPPNCANCGCHTRMRTYVRAE
ncbi:hypothetical protein LAUMK41_05629 [Mycobacterium attenuatum]|nr:hypothetical protein LAUMK41_05629 [Mycobacterium attenuatum]